MLNQSFEECRRIKVGQSDDVTAHKESREARDEEPEAVEHGQNTYRCRPGVTIWHLNECHILCIDRLSHIAVDVFVSENHTLRNSGCSG